MRGHARRTARRSRGDKSGQRLRPGQASGYRQAASSAPSRSCGKAGSAGHGFESQRSAPRTDRTAVEGLLAKFLFLSSPPAMLINQAAFNAPAEPIVKVSDELAAGVSVGTGQADILQKLGEPHSRISGDVERYTYFLQSGGSLKLDFEDGHVTQMRKASN